MATIEIDWDVAKAITMRRETESVTPNDVLRALFGLSPVPTSDPNTRTSIGGWNSGGTFFPDGTEFRAEYKGKTHTGQVREGMAFFNGERAYSPSEAARKITGGGRNGWFFWECRLPGQQTWRCINDMRLLGKSAAR